MNINVGIDPNVSFSYLERLINAGANEFFVGFMPPEWFNEYGFEVSCNRRYKTFQQFLEYDKLRNTVNYIHRRKKKIYIVINEHYYIFRQIQLIKKIVSHLNKIFVDGYIISDPAILLQLGDLLSDKDIHISVAAGVLNSEAVFYFYKLGARRIVLSRKLSISEIIDLCLFVSQNKLKIKFEVFIIGGCCYYNSGYCMSVHGYEDKAFCFDDSLMRSLHSRFLSIKGRFNEKAEFLIKNLPSVEVYRCGLCALLEFKEFPEIASVKIPGRGGDEVDRLKYAKLVKKILNKQGADRDYCRMLVNRDIHCNSYNCIYFLK